ncbi:MAG TPA: hypothetical protein VK838_02660 [Candidatus Limnocylindrales bacterium]|nr:hypothetical protein [Candidatus Limnocylindrales bacterium]
MIRHRVRVIPWLRRPGRLLLPEWLAITLGHDIVAWRPLDERELRHELAHVEQWNRHGWTLPARYVMASWRSLRAGEGWYRGNRFEVEARAAADSAQDEFHA